MINIDLQQLIQALDAQTRKELEKAAEGCVVRGGSKVLIEDMLLSMLATPESLLNKAIIDAEIELGELLSVLQPRAESSETQNPVFSVELVQWLQDALLLANLELERNYVDQAALILAFLRNSMRYVGTKYYKLLSTIDEQRLKDFVLADQVEQQSSANVIREGAESFLKKFTHNFTQLARDNKLDPVLCRDDAIRQMIDILARRRKNNPIIVGEAGVGKTAVVEGLAIRIAKGDVPEILQNVELLTLDMGLLQAGASMKGEFERRLKGLIDEVKASPKPIILFIDEAHTMIGSGGDAGGSDAANLLKPALARGELCTIAATTWSEYKKYFEKDAALARRFQAVQLHEPTIEEAVTILRGLAPVYEHSHGIYLRDDSVVAAAELSARYLAGRQLPDKAVDLLDTASARVKISLASAPEQIETLRNRISIDERQYEALTRDKLAGIKTDQEVLDTLEKTLTENRVKLEQLNEQWQHQKELAEQLLGLRKQYSQLQKVKTDLELELVNEQQEVSVTEVTDTIVEEVTEQGEHIVEEVIEAVTVKVTPEQVAEQLKQVQEELNKTHELLDKAQETESLVSFEVCPRLIAEVISNWTGIPVEQLAREHNARVMQFAEDLRERVRGQEQAVVALDKAIRTSAAGLNRPETPVGVFLFVGPSGVGKTETALALSDLLYGGDRFLTVINMSEFQEKHTVSRLIGSPPGYVGYGEGGMLTEAVRQKPYSVILLDEVEKADPDVMNLFYQIFDKGIANDGEGREINFRNTLIIMTSNLASDRIVALCKDGARPSPEALEDAIRPALSQHFKPALLGRMKVIPYYPVDGEVLHELIELKLGRLAHRMQQRKLELTYDKALVDVLAERCTYSDSGARLIDSLLDQYIVPHITDRLLAAMATKEELKRVNIVVGEDKAVVCEFY
ncbi:type VI secretion system ATPase TssH [Entomomonas sp. E2T0]|uniref:type VI secretion system ATPase TssH n=1 Tax=Entomomonas sp. E2T0 TaxID=2930213 RepID=UPI002228105E|nr:type VI secretion system ATPase TssH [Entomomonas sp. E2T0]UYZ84365.1 type VI secretion system ATPase TssH [Entomomonas sp. E2T0]